MKYLLIFAFFFIGCTHDKVVVVKNPKHDKNLKVKNPALIKKLYYKLYLTAKDLGNSKMIRDMRSEKTVVKKGPYIKYKGIHTGYAMWKGDAIIVDSRWVFNNEKMASGFYKDAVKLNSEGLKPVKKFEKVGDECLVFHGIVKHPKLPISLVSYFYYFRKGSVVAKVFMAWEVKTDSKPDISNLLSKTYETAKKAATHL